MATKKTYYDPHNGQTYYNGSKRGAFFWDAPESQKDESYINQYNYTPSYNAYRQYLEEERRRQEEEERRREEWQREHIAAMREQVQDGQSVANFDTQAARRKAEPKIRYEQAYDNWNAQNPEYKDKTAEEKYSLFAKELDEQNKLADASQGYRDFYNRNKKDPDFQRMSDDEKRRQYMHYLDQTVQDKGTLPEEQRVELSEYKYNGLTDKEKAAVDMYMQAKGQEFDERTMSGLDAIKNTLENGINWRSDERETRKRNEQEAINELIRLGWDADTAKTELSRYKELEDYRKTQEKNAEVAIDPNASAATKWGKSTVNTIDDILSSPYRGLYAKAGSWAEGEGVYGRNTSSPFSYVTNRDEEATRQVRENAIGNDHPTLQTAYDIGVSTAESLYTMLLTNAVAGAYGLSGAGTALKNAKKAGDVITKGMKGAAAAEKALEVATLVPFSANAYDSAYRDAVNRGFSDKQAEGYGMAVGATEALTEMFSLDKAWKLAEGTKVGRNLFLSAAIQAGIEGTEEVASEYGQRFADYVAVEVGKTGKTQKELDIEEFMAQGMSREEAVEAAKEKFYDQLKMAAIGGAVGGVTTAGIMMGVGAYRSKYGNNLTQAISDRYKNLKVEGDTAFENNLREEKAKYENNPVQYIADHYKVNSKEDAQVKQALQEIAEKEKEGKKLSVSDKSFITENVLANRDQFNQEYLDTLFDTGEDSIVPYKYRDVKTEVTEDQARTMLAEAAQSGDPKAFIDAQRKVRNSTVDEVAKHAEELIDFYAGSAMEHGITKEDIGKALIAEKQAYIAGITGEELNKDNLTPEAQIAYNDGKMEALQQKTRTTIENKDALNTDVTTKEGNTVTLKGVFTSDGIMTDDGAVKLENIDLDENKASNKAYHFADNYQSINLKNAFLNNINDGQNVENYNRDFGRIYDSALAGVSLENVKKESLTELTNDQIENIYETAVVERQARAAETFAEAFNGVKGTGAGKAFNESSSADPKMLKIASMMARATKYDIHLVDEVPQNKGARGAFLKSDNAVYVRADDFMRSLGHEFSHYIETYNKGEYDSLRNAVVNFAANKMGTDTFMRAVKGYGKLYKQGANQELSADDISGEMFNDIIPIILESKQGSKAFAKYLAENYGADEARTFGEKIKDVMDNLAGTIRKYLSNADHPTAYAKEMKKYADELGQFADQFIKALDGAIQNYNKGVQGESAGVQGDSETRFSLSEDSAGRELSEGQQEYFKNSQIRDKNGNLLVMHHGTASYGFDVFDIKKAKAANLYGRGFYFSKDSSHAGQYGQQYDVYLNIVNPLQPGTKSITKNQLLKFINAVANNEDYGIENYGQGATPQSVLASVWGKDDFSMLQDINATCIGDFAGAVKEFNRINKTSYDGINTPTETVAFYPNQIKDINNKKPTNADSMRFSLSEEDAKDIKKKAKKSKAVDVTKDLVAVHNLGEQQLIESLKLQGLPSPSIAIIRSGMMHDKYGAISLIFKSDTIDPKNSTRNKVYGGDGWTPTFPAIEVKINRSVAEKIWDKIDSLVSAAEQRSIGYANVDTDNLQDKANRNRGDVVDAYKDNKALQYAFLKDNGIDIDVPSEDVRLDEHWTNEQILAVLDIIKDRKQAESLREGYRAYESNPELVEELRQALNQQFRQKYVNKGNAKLFDKDLYEELSFNDFDHLTKGVFKYYREGIQQQMDSQAARAAIQEQIKEHEAEYDKWLRNLFDGIIEKRGLRNNKDVFLPSGNRRSWEALHDDYTLENIVKIMNQQEERGEAAFFSQSAIQALSTKNFKSLDEIRKSKGQLRVETEEEHEKRITEQSEKFTEICNEIMDKSESNSFIAFGRASDAIAEAIRRYRTVQGIDRELRQWRGLNIKSDTAQKIVDLMNEIAENPTGYFEAKPKRAVWLDEIKKAVIPNNVSEDTIKALDDAGIPYEMYRYEDEGQRRDIIAAMEDVKFSLSEDSEGRELSDDQVKYFKNSKAVDAKGRLLELYHGTEAQAFSVFSTPGIWVTPDKELATEYAGEWNNWRNETEGYGKIKYETNGMEPEVYGDKYLRMYKVYANVTNPVFLGELNRTLPDDYAGMEFDTLGIKTEEQFDKLYDLVQQHIGDKVWQLTETKEFIDLMKELGYDGMFASENGHRTICVFDSNQLKKVDNLTPTEDKDIRYSISENSNGEPLSEDQQRYFKDSGIRDEQGRLLQMYHGTTKGGFTIFDPKKSDDNLSLFFTDNADVATTYSGSTDTINPYKAVDSQKTKYRGNYPVYLDIQNPLVVEGGNKIDGTVDDLSVSKYKNITAFTFVTPTGIHTIKIANSKADSYIEETFGEDADRVKQAVGSIGTISFEDFSEAVKDYTDGENFVIRDGNDVVVMEGGEATDDIEIYRGTLKGAIDFFNKTLHINVPLRADISKNLKNVKVNTVVPSNWNNIRFDGGRANTRYISSYAHEHGYDGVFFKNIIDNGGAASGEERETKSSNIAIAFHSDQVKSVYNLHPTDDPDIRYSISEDSEGRELAEGQQRYFDKSQALDEQSRLLSLYHGTPNAGFTIFKPGTRGGTWLTTSREDAASYAGYTDREFVPGEKAETIKTISGQYAIGDKFFFDTKEDRDAFLKKHPNADNAISEAEYEANRWDDEFEDRWEESREVWKDYYRYEKEHLSNTDVWEVIDHPDRYTVADLKRAWLEYDSNAAFDDEFDYTESRYKEILAEGLKDALEEIGGREQPFNVRVRLPKGTQGEIQRNVNNRIYSVYANVENPAILDAENTDIAYKLGYDAIEEALNDDRYDGVIVKNARQGAYKKPATIVITKNAEQVKLTSNLNPTSSKDIRFSFEDEGGWIDFDEVLGESISEEKAVDILEKGMEALKNKDVDVPKLRTLALKIRNEYGSSYNANKLADDLRKAFAYMQTEDHVDYQTMMGILKDIARPVIEEAGEKVGEEEYKHFLEYFKGKKIKLTSTQKEEVRHTFGSYGAYRNAMMPITISDNGEFTLDQLWDEMVQHGGYMLDVDANEGDMPINLLDTLQAMRPYVRNDFGGDTEDLAKDLAMRIVEEYIQGESAKEMHKELTEYRNRLKKDYQERLKDLKGRANAEVLARNKRRAEEKAERQKARDLKVKIKQNANKLYTWAVKPTEGKSVPHNMMVPVMQFLQGIDFVDPVITVSDDGKYHIRLFDRVDYEDGHKKFIYKDLVGDTREDVLRQFNEAIGRGEGTKEQRSWTDKMQGIRDIYNKVLNDTDFEDTDMDFLMQTLDAQGLAEEFDDLLSRHKGQASMNSLSSKELELINNIIQNIFHAVNQGNKAFSQPSVDIVNLAQSTMKDAEGKEIKSRGRFMEGLHKMLRLDNVTPRTFFKLLGKRGSEVYKFLRGGLNQEIIDLKKASEFMEEAMKGIDAKAWTGRSATIHEIPVSEGTIRLTDAQIMGLYMTIRRNGGKDRIKGGVKIDDIRTKGRPIQQKAMHLTDADIEKIEAILTPEQIALAKKMQQYMAKDCSEQGNDTSMRLYGFKKFTDDTYYPWTVDKDTVATTNTSENIPMFTGIERSGFTKQLKEGATNPLVIRDIFDVFTDHVSQMAAYHGYAASVKDTLRWMNYRERSDADGFVNWHTNKKAINDLTGSKQGVGYIRNLLLDINKANKSQYIGNFTDLLIGNYKAAAVGANLRVVAQQPTAYFRALNMIDPKYLLTVNPATAIKNIKRSQEQSPISWWKSKGYYETNLGQPIKEIVTGIASPAEKAKDIMMAPAGWADDFTWGFLYTAVEKEQRDLLKGQNLTAEQFRQAVNDRFDEVVDNTQVVDSTLHRSQYMRSTDRLNKIQTAFMAEPTKSYNMLLEAFLEDRNDKSGKRTTRAIAAFLLSSLATSAAAAVVDAMRKAKDDEDWWEVWLKNLQENAADNINPFNLLPVVKDVSAGIYNLLTGTSTFGQSGNRFDIEAISSIMSAVQMIPKLIEGESNKTGYGAALTMIKPISQITGIPVYNLTKDTVALYNTFFDNIETTINSGSTAKNEKKKSFVSDVNRERSEETLDEGIVDAIENGVSIYDLKGAVKSEYKNKYFDAYAEGNTEEAQAIAERAARAYARMGMSDEDIDAEINEWQEETITYALLDKAIASGEGIEEEIKHVQEGKADEKIIKHIMDRFSDTIAYEDVHETESDWRGNVEKALQAIDPTLTFDTANEEAMQQAAEKAAEQQAKEEKAGYKADFFASVESKNGTAGRKALDGLKAMGVDAKSAKTMVSTQYHDAWKEAKTPAEKQKAKSDWMSAYKLVCNYYGVEYKDLDKTWADWEKDQ